MTRVAALQRRKPANESARLHLLIKEVGSPMLESGSAEAFDETIVIAQMKGESQSSFTERTLERFAAMTRSGRRLGAVTLQVGSQHDELTCSLRRSALGALLKDRALSAGASEILLEAPATLPGDAHQVLLALVDDLLQLPECATLAVRLRFHTVREAAPDGDSGVFWVTPRC